MTGLAVTRYGMHTGMLAPAGAPYSLVRLAGAVSKLSPLVIFYALSNVPGAGAKSQPTWSPGKPANKFIECMNACDKVEHEFLRLLCQITCGVIDIFKKKEKRPGDL
jgi:hypothetical protein